MDLSFQSAIGTGSGRDLNSTSPVPQSAAQADFRIEMSVIMVHDSLSL